MTYFKDAAKRKLSAEFEYPYILHDGVLKVCDRSFYVVAETLSSGSLHFHKLFNETSCMEVVIDNVDPNAFELFLQIINGNDLVTLPITIIVSSFDMAYRFVAPKVVSLCEAYIDAEFDSLNEIHFQLLETACNHEVEDLKTRLLHEVVNKLDSFNLIKLLQMAFEHNLDFLKKHLRSYIYTAKSQEEWNRCLECPDRIQQKECTHTEMYSQIIAHNSLIAKNIDEILKLSEEIKTFVLVSSISYC